MNQNLLLQETAATTAATTVADLQHIRYLDGNEYNSKTRNDITKVFLVNFVSIFHFVSVKRHLNLFRNALTSIWDRIWEIYEK